MNPGTKRILVGCGGGCLAVLLLGIASCVAFTAWLRAPGELLEPQALLDPEAVGYVEGRLELDNPGTQALFDSAVELFEAQEAPLDSAVIRALMAWNRSRQIRDLRRLFPARLSWTVYPGEEESDTTSVASISIQRASHQFLLTDWILGLVLRRVDEVAVLEHLGETIFVFEDDAKMEGAEAEELERAARAASADGEPDFRLFTFLRREGLFFATGEGAARRAIERLEQRGLPEAGSEASRLEILLARVPAELQFRGAFVNPGGELVTLASPVLGEVDEEELARTAAQLSSALGEVEAATIGGGFLPSGDMVLELVLHDDSPPPELRRALDEILGRAAEEVPLEWSVVEGSGTVVVSARLRDVPQLVRERAAEWREEVTREAIRERRDDRRRETVEEPPP